MHIPSSIRIGRRATDAPTWARRPGPTLLNRQNTERLLSILSPLLLLALWELFARVGTIDTRFFPAPSTIFETFVQMLRPTGQFPQGELWANLSASLQRIAIGFLLGAVPGVIIGLAMGLF